jgi:metallo-beta-lactamase family protein
VLHHLQSCIERPEHTVVIVGFQAPHTLGRRLVEKRARVRIFGVEQDRRAEVSVLNGFSAHAGQDELVGFVQTMRGRGGVGHVALVHGEPAPQKSLAKKLLELGVSSVSIPDRGEELVV